MLVGLHVLLQGARRHQENFLLHKIFQQKINDLFLIICSFSRKMEILIKKIPLCIGNFHEKINSI